VKTGFVRNTKGVMSIMKSSPLRQSADRAALGAVMSFLLTSVQDEYGQRVYRTL
jgi:hypothetical protein